MTNRIDFFQPEQSQLSIPAARLCVYLDNSPCEQLEVLEIVRQN